MHRKKQKYETINTTYWEWIRASRKSTSFKYQYGTEKDLDNQLDTLYEIKLEGAQKGQEPNGLKKEKKSLIVLFKTRK